MHLSVEFKPEDFTLMQEEESISFGDLMPDFSEHRRVGLLTRYSLDGLGSSNMLMACIAQFYECYLKAKDRLFYLPGLFYFSASRSRC